jgi:hypothetical protein
LSNQITIGEFDAEPAAVARANNLSRTKTALDSWERRQSGTRAHSFLQTIQARDWTDIH